MDGRQHETAPERGSGTLGLGEASHDESVARKKGQRWTVDMQSGEAGSAGLKPHFADACETGSPFGGSGQQLDGGNPLSRRCIGKPV